MPVILQATGPFLEPHSGCWQRDNPKAVFQDAGDSRTGKKIMILSPMPPATGPFAANPDPNDIDGDGLYDAGDSVGYTLGELPSLIEMDAITTADGITTAASAS